jgi:hypothetical protein
MNYDVYLVVELIGFSPLLVYVRAHDLVPWLFIFFFCHMHNFVLFSFISFELLNAND